MKYHFTPEGSIKLANPNYWMLSTELNKFTQEEIQNILSDMEKVFEGKCKGSSFSQNVVIVTFKIDLSTIEDYEDVIGTENTQDIYKMLKELKNHKEKQ